MRMLVENGFVVTMDPALGDLPRADVLIDDGKIVQVGPDLDAGDAATTIDATGCVVVPGFVDTHRHMWETALRGILPSCTLDGYLEKVVGSIGPAYRPEDIYTGNLLGAWDALNAGITTIVDWSHCNNTPEHADAGIGGLRAAGIRAMYTHGTPSGGEWWAYSDQGHPDARRIREVHFSSGDDLLTFALALRGPGLTTPEVCVSDWALARELDARISIHVGARVTGVHLQQITALDEAGLLGPDILHVHVNNSTDEELRAIKRSGGSVSVAPFVEMIMGHGRPPIHRLLEHGLTPTLGVDVVTTSPGDLFTQMRTALAYGRITTFQEEDPDLAFASTISHTDALGFATVAGAEACGLGERIGTLTPGKDADLVLIRADDVNTMPMIDPVATVVTSADTSNVDTVIVRGEVRKRAGKLVGVDLGELRAMAEQSRDHILQVSGLAPAWHARAHRSSQPAGS